MAMSNTDEMLVETLLWVITILYIPLMVSKF